MLMASKDSSRLLGLSRSPGRVWPVGFVITEVSLATKVPLAAMLILCGRIGGCSNGLF